MRVIRITGKRILHIVLLLIIIYFPTEYSYANEINRLYVDDPINNQNTIHSDNDILVSGWSVNTSGTQSIRIYVNGILSGEAELGFSRADVSEVYPDYPEGDYSGFQYMINSQSLIIGKNEIIVQAIGNNSTIKSASRTIKVISRINSGNLDEPRNDNNVHNADILVRGWYLNSSGTDKIEIYLNDSLYESTTIGKIREDINKKYLEYPDSLYTGFESYLNLYDVHSGENIIKVRMYGNDGSTKTFSRRIFVKKKENRGYIDIPEYKAVSHDSSIKVRGWAINDSGIKEVKVLLNGNHIGNAAIGLQRNDVYEAYPEYLNSKNSGYEYSMEMKHIKAGEHKLEIQVVGSDGTQNSYIRVFNLTKLNSRGYIDTPIHKNIYGNEFKVSGWSLHADGTKEIKVYIDNKFITNTIVNESRPDVALAFPNYSKASQSGFNATININELRSGLQELKIVSIGSDESIHTMSKQINIIKPINRLIIDNPLSNENIYNDDVIIEGWSLNASGTTEVSVYLNGQELGKATRGIYRPDVYKIYSQYPEMDYAGFQYKINVDTLSPGNHEVVVKANGRDGTIMVTRKSFVINKPINRTIIDYPTSSDKISISDVIVKGWAVNASGISRIRLLVNGLDVGTPNIGIIRKDVNNAYQYYQDSLTSGYEMKIESRYLKSGINVIHVQTYGNDGTFHETKELFYLQELYYYNSYYDKTLAAALELQMKKNPQTDLYGGGWKNAAEVDVKHQLDPGSHYSFDNGKIDDDIIKKVVITTDTLNIRNGPNNSNMIIGTAVANQIFDVIQVSNGWINIKNEVIQGWIAGAYSAKIGTERGVPAEVIGNHSNEILQFIVLSDFLGVNNNEFSMLLNGKGILQNLGDIILETSKFNNINELYVLVHALLETGNGTSLLSNGILVSKVNNVNVAPRISYNMFGIGAYDNDPERLGSEYAYNQGWFTPEDAIKGGIEWLSKQYINNIKYKQNTLYKMRWNPAFPGVHQYATDIGWASKQSRMMQLVSDYSQSLKVPIKMDIPVYLRE